MLAKDHLAIQTAVHLVIYIAKRQASQVPAGFRQCLISLNLDHSLLGAPAAEGGKPKDGS
jgi:hypothetical protein